VAVVVTVWWLAGMAAALGRLAVEGSDMHRAVERSTAEVAISAAFAGAALLAAAAALVCMGAGPRDVFALHYESVALLATHAAALLAFFVAYAVYLTSHVVWYTIDSALVAAALGNAFWTLYYPAALSYQAPWNLPPAAAIEAERGGLGGDGAAGDGGAGTSGTGSTSVSCSASESPRGGWVEAMCCIPSCTPRSRRVSNAASSVASSVAGAGATAPPAGSLLPAPHGSEDPPGSLFIRARARSSLVVTESRSMRTVLDELLRDGLGRHLLAAHLQRELALENLALFLESQRFRRLVLAGQASLGLDVTAGAGAAARGPGLVGGGGGSSAGDAITTASAAASHAGGGRNMTFLPSMGASIVDAGSTVYVAPEVMAEAREGASALNATRLMRPLPSAGGGSALPPGLGGEWRHSGSGGGGGGGAGGAAPWAGGGARPGRSARPPGTGGASPSGAARAPQTAAVSMGGARAPAASLTASRGGSVGTSQWGTARQPFGNAPPAYMHRPPLRYALAIWLQYVTPGAPLQVNLPSTIVSAMRARLTAALASFCARAGVSPATPLGAVRLAAVQGTLSNGSGYYTGSAVGFIGGGGGGAVVGSGVIGAGGSGVMSAGGSGVIGGGVGGSPAMAAGAASSTPTASTPAVGGGGGAGAAEEAVAATVLVAPVATGASAAALTSSPIPTGAAAEPIMQLAAALAAAPLIAAQFDVLPADLFEDAAREVHALILYDSLPRFLATKAYALWSQRRPAAASKAVHRKPTTATAAAVAGGGTAGGAAAAAGASAGGVPGLLASLSRRRLVIGGDDSSGPTDGGGGTGGGTGGGAGSGRTGATTPGGSVVGGAAGVGATPPLMSPPPLGATLPHKSSFKRTTVVPV